jgi:transposase
MRVQSKELNFKGQNIYIGLDVHKKDWKVRIQSKELSYRTFSQPPSVDALVQHLHRNFPGATYYSAYESGFSGFWAHRALVSQGVNNIVVHAVDVPTTQKERSFKTDKRDCRKIARSLCNEELEALHVPSIKTQEDRSLVRLRLTFRKDLTRCKNRVKCLLNLYGKEIPERFLSSSHWSNVFIKWLKEVKFETGSAEQALQLLIRQVEQLRSTLLDVTRKIRKLAQSPDYCANMELMLKLPGVGLVTAIAFLTQLETIDRFPNTDSLAGYLGLVPSCHSSGDRENTGEMTYRGNKWLRELLIECAWSAARSDPALHLAYLDLCKRMKPNNALIRIARKLLNRMYYVLKNKREYEKSIVQ